MRIILAILYGVLFTLCFAPYHLYVMGFVSFTGLLYLLDRAGSGKAVFWYGFLFAFAHHVTGLYWISISMLVEPDKFAWMIPFAVSVIPAYLSLYTGLICFLTYRFGFNQITKVLFFSGAWTLAEFARGNLFTGFPWNLAGYTFLFNDSIAQGASIIGVYGLSIITLLVFTTPYLAINYIRRSADRHWIYKYCLSLYYIMPAIFALSWLNNWGTERIEDNKTKYERMNIRIVQPNIPQKEKFDQLRIGDHLFKYYNLSLQEGGMEDYVPDLIVWPEAATMLNISEDRDFQDEVADIIPFSTHLILGSLRFEGWSQNMKVFNSVQFVDSEGKILKEHYDKNHLVPFGEYVPLRKFLPGVDMIAKGIGDFSRGKGRQTIRLDAKPPFSPLICYEIIFPGEVVDKNGFLKPKWLLNLTNDAWFGNSTGPYQHLDITRMRAIEEGLPVIRAANTGISAVIDATGRVIQSLELNHEGIIDTKLPSALEEKTYYSKMGNITALQIAAGMVILSLILKCISKVLLRDPRKNHEETH